MLAIVQAFIFFKKECIEKKFTELTQCNFLTLCLQVNS